MPPFRLYFFISFLVFLALAAMDVAITPEVSMDGDGVVLDTTADGSINFTITDPDGLIYQQILNIVINDVGDSLLVKQNRWDDFIDRNSEGKISYYFVSSLVRNRHVTAGQFLDEFMGYVPICILSIVPLSAALLSLLLWGKRRYYLETLVFSLHYFAFGLVCYLIYSGLTYLFDSQLPEILFLLSLVVYLFLAIKQAFDLTRWRLVFTTACMVLLLGIIVFPAAIIATSLFTFVFL